MRILMLKMKPPFPLESGTDCVSYHLLRTLSEEHEITYVTLTRSPQDEEALRELGRYCARILAVRQPNLRSDFHRVFYKLLYLALCCVTATPMEVWYNTPWSLRRKVKRLLSEESFDLIHVEYWYAAPYARYARRGRRALLKHDVAYLADLRLLEKRASRLALWWSRLQLGWRRWAELRQCRHFDVVLTLTDPDRDALASSSRRLPEVKALPALFLPFPELPRQDEDERRLVFLGHLGRSIVQDAVIYFCDEILPRVQRERPDVVLEIIGGEEHRVRHLASRPGVELSGFVRQVGERIQRAAVMVVPLRAGSGIKLKVIEGLFAGIAIVTTSVGAEGIGLTHGREVLIADDAETFARCVVELVGDRERRRAMGERGRRFAQERYGSEEARRQLLRFYREQVIATG